MTDMILSPGMEAQHVPFLMLALEQQAAKPGPPSFRISRLHKKHGFDTVLHGIFGKLLQDRRRIGVWPIIKRDQKSPFAGIHCHSALRSSELDLTTFPVQTYSFEYNHAIGPDADS